MRILAKLCLLSVSIWMLAACAAPAPDVPLLGLAATPTAIPTPTPTPVPTALPLSLIDNVRATRLSTPVPKPGAPCGVVDVLDFPLGAPEGEDYSARWSFGRYSDNYNGIHAGEDWIFLNGDSMRKPIYAIGHGQVTFAQPYGWGVDQGVVIIRHVFSDGRTILSFYGHVDPPSVALNVGDCVVRGQQVGAIGKPRGRPHLHFEIRHHLPATPGPGYWSVDPTLAGWEPPSVYIWTSRMSTAPGVSWLRPFTSTTSTGIGALNNVAIVYDNDQLIGLNPIDSQVQWTQALPRLDQTLFDVKGAALYLSTRSGNLRSIKSDGTLNWQTDFGDLDRMQLLPMPGGGVIVHFDQKLIGFSATGDRLWQIEQIIAPSDWLVQADRILFSDQSATYSLDRSGRVTKLAEIGGRLAYSRDRLFIYAPDGLYRLSDRPPLVDLILPIDRGIFNTDRFFALDEDTLLIEHQGLSDRQLIALNADGTLRWRRSILELGDSLPYLIPIDGQLYAITLDGDVLRIDPYSGSAWRLFNGGPLLPLLGKPWGVATNGRLIFDFRGGTLVGFDLDAVEQIDLGE
jgi:murein DD-endopeptidase MepM/ murein hydrolase activator NlpD